MSGLHLTPISFADACLFIEAHHRHNRPPIGMKFCTAVADEDGTLRGVAIVGRPVARSLDDGRTLEVNRTATDGTGNANSMLYGAAWRAAKALGYTRLVTYTQATESGASLRAAGWRVIAQRAPRAGWSTPSRPREDRGADKHAANALGGIVTPLAEATQIAHDAWVYATEHGTDQQIADAEAELRCWEQEAEER